VSWLKSRPGGASARYKTLVSSGDVSLIILLRSTGSSWSVYHRRIAEARPDRGLLQHCRGLVRPGRYTRLRVRDVFHDGLSVACRVRKSPESVGDVDSAHHIETAKPFARAEVVSTGKGLLDRV